MKAEEQGQRSKINPFTVALVVGLGWGLVFGFVDGLPILLELPIFPHLRVRLQALTYLMVWYGLVGTAFLGLLGGIAWGLSRLLGRAPGRRGLVAFYSGVFVGLATLTGGIYSLNVPLRQLDEPGYPTVALVLTVLGSVVGVMVGLGIYGAVGWWRSRGGLLRLLRWRLVRTSVVSVFILGVAALFTVGIYRGYLRDLAIFWPDPSGQVATSENPNILLITIDALRADHLGVYGYDPEISPNIDALAKRGVVFEQAIAQAPWTASSVPSFLTSLYPTELGIRREGITPADIHIDRMRVTLAEALQEAGYTTHAYLTNPLVLSENGFSQGFDHFAEARSELSFDLDVLQERTLLWLFCERSARNAYTRPICGLFDQGHGQLFDPRLGWNSDPVIAEEAKRFMRLRQDERFFLWLFFIGPHAPYDPAQPFRPLPSEITPERERYLRTLLWLQFGKITPRPVDLRAMISLYDGEVAYADALVGQLMDQLDSLGLTDRTVVILQADHGEEFYDHGSYGHGHSLYDELLRVPLIVSGPGVEASGRRVETQVRLLDLVPTVCDLAGTPTPAEAGGRSLVPFLEGKTMEELPAFSEGLNMIYENKSVRRGGYKLIYGPERETVELYDLRADPHEQVNLAEQEVEVVETMLTDLQAWMLQSAQVATELPRLRPLGQEMDEEMQRILRDAGY